MDPKAVQQACMADLGRQRQEELPLSNRERKGASYLPNQRNGTSHYAPDLKRGLENKWNIQIQDEETAQMQGLAVDDTRPWAKKIASEYMERHAFEVAPPLVPQEPRGRKWSKNAVKSKSLPAKVNSLDDQVFLGSNVRDTVVSKPKSKTIESRSIPLSTSGVTMNDNQTGRAMPYVTVACDSEPLQNMSSIGNRSPNSPGRRQSDNGHKTESASRSPIKTSLPMRTSRAQEREQLVYKGICKLLNPQDGGVLFIVSFSLKIQIDSDRAVLTMCAADKADKVYDVLDLAPPTLRSDCCHIHSTARNGVSYLLQFSGTTDAGKFRLYLESLQQAAARSKSGTTNTTLGSAPESVSMSQSQGIFESSKSRKAHTERKTSSLIMASEYHTVQPIQGLQRTNQLVDVDSPSQTTDVEDAEIATIEDAAEKLFDVIEKILPEASAAGLQLSEAAIHDIEDTAIDSWLTRGFLISETDGMKSELLELLRILVRIKRKAKSRKHLFQAMSTIQSLKDYDSIGDKMAKPARIIYSPSEIESLASAQIPTPTNLKKSIMSPYQGPKFPHSPADPVIALAKHKAWLTGDTVPHDEVVAVGCPVQTTDQQANQGKQVAVAQRNVRDHGALPPKSPSTSTGLGTSR